MKPRSDGSTLSFSFIEPSFGRRLGGAVIDALLVGAPAGLIAGAFLDDSVAAWLGLLVVATYHAVLTSRSGQTIGKMLVRTHVVRLRDGGIPPVPNVLIRVLVLFAGAIAGVALPSLSPVEVLLTIVVLAPVMQPPLHRGLHDRASSTVVTCTPESPV